MAESKEIALRKTDIASFVEITSAVPGDPIYDGLTAIYNYVTAYANNLPEEARKGAYEKRYAIGDLWRRLKEYEKLVKQIKPVIESMASDVTMPDVFKWQQGATKTKKEVTDNAELWRRLEKEGVSLDSFLSICKVDFDAAVEISGKNERAFLEEFAGDICNVTSAQNKPTLKAL